jgi:hypothetical protein
MSPSEKRETARRLLAERARRVNTIRRRIVAGALAAFVMAWGVIAWTGSMGTTTSSSAAATDTTSSSDTGTTQSSGGATQSGGSSAAPSPMTTKQS